MTYKERVRKEYPSSIAVHVISEARCQHYRIWPTNDYSDWKYSPGSIGQGESYLDAWKDAYNNISKKRIHKILNREVKTNERKNE